jgi:hypothetical protein
MDGTMQSSGETVNGQKQGLWVERYDGGSVAREVRFQNGKRQGLSTAYREDGTKAEQGEFRDDLQTGAWRQWDERGRLTAIRLFQDGRFLGISKPGPGGEDQSGRRQGRWIDMLEEGREEGHYDHDRRIGFWKHWNREGRRIATVLYWGDRILGRSPVGADGGSEPDARYQRLPRNLVRRDLCTHPRWRALRSRLALAAVPGSACGPASTSVLVRLKVGKTDVAAVAIHDPTPANHDGPVVRSSFWVDLGGEGGVLGDEGPPLFPRKRPLTAAQAQALVQGRLVIGYRFDQIATDAEANASLDPPARRVVLAFPPGIRETSEGHEVRLWSCSRSCGQGQLCNTLSLHIATVTREEGASVDTLDFAEGGPSDGSGGLPLPPP